MRLKPACLTLMLVTAALSCGADPGSFSMSFSWGQAPEESVYIWVRMEERTSVETPGAILASAGTGEYVPGEGVALEMGEVPNGDNRYVIAEVREGSNSNLAILYFGISKPFVMRAGEHTHVDVPLTLQTPESMLHEASVELLFAGEERTKVGSNDIVAATVATRSTGAISVMLANDASFDE